MHVEVAAVTAADPFLPPASEGSAEVAREVADLAVSGTMGRVHVAEALSYRRQAPRN